MTTNNDDFKKDVEVAEKAIEKMERVKRLHKELEENIAFIFELNAVINETRTVKILRMLHGIQSLEAYQGLPFYERALLGVCIGTEALKEPIPVREDSLAHVFFLHIVAQPQYQRFDEIEKSIFAIGFLDDFSATLSEKFLGVHITSLDDILNELIDKQGGILDELIDKQGGTKNNG